MSSLGLTAAWPVPNVAAVVVSAGSVVERTGDGDRLFRLASLGKVVTAWAVLVAAEEGSVRLDDPVGPPGSTLRHLLAHASGLPFEGDVPVAAPGRRRIYSNTGIELAAHHLAERTGMAFDAYLHEAVLVPLAMHDSEQRGSPAHGLWSTTNDVAAFLGELLRPRLVDASTHHEAVSAQFPDLAGTVPGVGRFAPCPWGLGPEIHGAKEPHWMPAEASPRTFGHFGGAGTMMWVDPDADIALVALADRPFDDWGGDALMLWPRLGSAVLEEWGSRVRMR